MDGLVYIVDLNELDDGERVRISMDFTVNYGEFVRAPEPMPNIGDDVRIHSDDDDTLYWAKVKELASDRDAIVTIRWDTRVPVLNRMEWSAQVVPSSSYWTDPTTEADYKNRSDNLGASFA